MTEQRAIVVGGGLVGLAAAVAAARAGLDVVHVAPKAPPDRRTSALMLPSVEYLRASGLLDDPAQIGEPLTAIRIIDATGRLIRAPETLFEAAEFGLPAFGWNLPNVKLAAAFGAARSSLPNLELRECALGAIAREGDAWRLDLDDGTSLTASLVIGADGKKSMVRAAAAIPARERPFTESALVADLALGRPLGGASVEFHYPRGPFTLVPAGGDRANLVWIDDSDVLATARAMGPDGLRDRFLEKSQRLFGNITPLTPAFVFPLSMLEVAVAGRDGVVLVGEAAHAFPPIGAQGLNLGLRDVADLATVLGEGRDGAGWATGVTTAYAARRAADLSRTGGVVNTLFRSLISDLLPAQAARATGLWTLKLLPGLRKRAFDLGMGVR